MEVEELSKRIKKKFGTIRSFCRCADQSAYELQRLFACERNLPNNNPDRTKRLQELGDLVKSTDPKKDDKKIGTELRGKIWSEIEKRGGATRFELAHPEFSKQIIYQISNGIRNRITPLVKKLIKILEIEQ